MDNMYNPHDIEGLFKKYLLSGKISFITLKNYLSDFRHFWGWLKVYSSNKFPTFDENNLINYLTASVLKEYQEYLEHNNIPIKTINRRLSTLRHFCKFCSTANLTNSNLIDQITNVKKTSNKPNNYTLLDKIDTSNLEEHTQTKPNNNRTIVAFIIITIILGISILYYNIHLFKYTKKASVLTLPTSITKGKVFSFQMRLTDKLGNPINTKTDVTFKLYNAPKGGKALYTGSCLGINAVSPEINGFFKVIIGSDCNMKEIPISIFYENLSLYLGISINTDPEMRPRQKITNVEYANDSNTLQGFPVGVKASTIPYINSNGDLLINTYSPGIRSTSNNANFALSSANSLKIQSAGLGDIILAATEDGTLKFQTGKSTKVYIDNDGNVGIGTITPTEKLHITNGDINIDGGYGLKFDSLGKLGYIMRGDGTRFVPSMLQYSDLPLSAQGLRDEGAIIRLTTASDKVGIGTSSPDAKFHLANSGIPAVGKALAIFDQYENQNILVASAAGAIKLALTKDGKLGLGLANASYQLQLSEDSAAKPTSNTWTIVSDRRLKEDITPFTDGLSILEQINPVNYVLNGKANMPKGTSGIGVIAQDVKNIIPYTISTFKAKFNSEDKDSSEFYSFDSSALTFVIINAIKDLNTKINDLTVKIINSNEKIISPVIETSDIIATGTANLNKIITNEIKPADGEISFNLDKQNNKDRLSQLIIKGLKGKTVTVIDSSGNINTQGDITANSASLSGTLTARQIVAQTATFSGSLTANEASISGKLVAREIEADNINEIQSLLAKIKNEDLPSAKNYQIDKNLTLDELTVIKSVNLYNASVANLLTAGNITIQDNSVLSLAYELKLSALARINFFEGDLIISKGGDLTTLGSLTAQGGVRTNILQPINSNDDLIIPLNSKENIKSKIKIQNSQGDQVASIDASGEARFNNLSISGLTVDKYLEATQEGAIIAAPLNFNKNGIYAPAIEASTKTAGVGILPASSSEVIIYSDKVSKDSLIYITPTSSTQGKSLFVADKNTCSSTMTLDTCRKYFKVAIDEAANTTIKFNWWVVK